MSVARDSSCGTPDPLAAPRSVCVLGLGYIGLATAAMLASRDFRVLGVDIKPHIVEAVNRGVSHIEDPGLDPLIRETVAAGALRARDRPEPSDAFIIAVPTPVRSDGNHTPDLGYVYAALDDLLPVLRPGNLVILESTSPVGTTRELAGRIRAARPDLRPPLPGEPSPNLYLAYCPERIIPGRMLAELGENDRIIGGMDAISSALAHAVYSRVSSGICHSSDDRTAEMVKLVENAYRDVNIAFANELSILCRGLGLDAFNVIALANRHPRVSILRPGPGVGGHCIAVDPWFIVSSDRKNSRLIAAARAVNDAKPDIVVEDIVAAAGGQDGAVLCLGLTYKENVGDFRESPALAIARAVTARLGARVLCVDEFADHGPEALQATGGLRLVSLEDGLARAGIVALLVGHDRFRGLALRPDQILLDVVGLLG
ncbi:MAG: nucleotide sugar dehydrogenase [Alphaproteobacteria bacterium]|nr:nucleotide sugar dehydrogenase [Alphaproteobacteria bacterium]